MSEERAWIAEAEEMVLRIGPLPPRVAAAMRTVPRHRFVPATFRDRAYDDEPLPVGRGESTISAPHMVALQLEWSELQENLDVLEIGSGSGYLLALIAELVAPRGRVDGIEIDPQLAELARRTLRGLGYASRVSVLTGDAHDALPRNARYARILVSCAAPEILPVWRTALEPEGILVVPLGDRWEQTLTRVKMRDGRETIEEGPQCRFVPLKSSRGPDI